MLRWWSSLNSSSSKSLLKTWECFHKFDMKLIFVAKNNIYTTMSTNLGSFISLQSIFLFWYVMRLENCNYDLFFFLVPQENNVRSWVCTHMRRQEALSTSINLINHIHNLKIYAQAFCFSTQVILFIFIV